MNNRTNGYYLVDNTHYIELNEVTEGYTYKCRIKENPEPEFTGLIPWESICNVPINCPLAAARALCIEEIGLKGETIVNVEWRKRNETWKHEI